jgi:hydrogenase maturation protease
MDNVVTSKKRVLVLCLGNEILSDDGFGPEVARRLQAENELDLAADVVFAPVAGFQLLDLLTDRKRVLVVDTIRTGTAEAGTLHHFPIGALTPSHSLTSSHQISLPTAIELGKRLSLNMPDVIEGMAVEAQDLETLSEELTLPIRGAVEKALTFIHEWIRQNSTEEPS